MSAIVDSELMTIKNRVQLGTVIALTSEWLIAIVPEYREALDIKPGSLILFETKENQLAGRGSVHAQDP